MLDMMSLQEAYKLELVDKCLIFTSPLSALYCWLRLQLYKDAQEGVVFHSLNFVILFCTEQGSFMDYPYRVIHSPLLEHVL